MSEEKTLEKLIVLGRAAPDQMKDGRETLCVGGWTKEDGFVRLYPTSVRSNLKRWNVVDVPVERNPQDSRIESWKIQGSRNEWNNLHKKIIQSGDLKNRNDRIEMLNQIPKINCIQDLNEKKLSLGLIIPKKIIKTELVSRDDHEKELVIQTSLDDFFGDAPGREVFKMFTKKNYPYIPRIHWECPGPCKLKQGYHTSQIITQEVYEWFRRNMKQHEEWDKVFDNLRIEDEEYNKWFFVGNQNQFRKSFMIISILRYKKTVKSKSNKPSSSSFEDFF